MVPIGCGDERRRVIFVFLFSPWPRFIEDAIQNVTQLLICEMKIKNERSQITVYVPFKELIRCESQKKFKMRGIRKYGTVK